MTPPRAPRVVVVGAGPAGTAAAITLVRGGAEVTLCDRARFPRDKCCGDGLTIAALRELERLGLRREHVASWLDIEEISVRSPTGRTTRMSVLDAGRPGGAVARRVHLDAALVDLARSAGASVLEGAGFESLSVEDDLEVHLGDSTHDADYVVAADGAWSPVRRSLGTLDGHRVPAVPGWTAASRGEFHAFRTYATGPPPQAGRRLWFHLDSALLPGYAWSFPTADGSTNVGIGLLRHTNGGSELAAAWTKVLAGPFFTEVLGPRPTFEASVRSWPIPAGASSSGLVGARGRVLFVGDAARAADPFSGEGIAQALETGRCAAEAILEHGSDGPVAVGAAYRGAQQKTLLREQRVSFALRAALVYPAAARAAVRLSDANPWTRRASGRFLYEAYPRWAALSPRRLARKAVRG